MARPYRTPWSLDSRAGKEIIREPTPQQSVAMQAIITAEQSITSGRCPNDGGKLKRGACSRCEFTLHVLPSYVPSVPEGAGYNRKPTRGPGVRREHGT